MDMERERGMERAMDRSRNDDLNRESDHELPGQRRLLWVRERVLGAVHQVIHA